MTQKLEGGWLDGEECIVYQRCSTCEHIWYFRRGFCPSCGAANPTMQRAAGTGQVYARSLVHRAPSQALRAFAPYLIVLVDMDEEFRLMAHGDPSLVIGDRVHARFIQFGDVLVPRFERASE